jgi:hypothetical protein
MPMWSRSDVGFSSMRPLRLTIIVSAAMIRAGSPSAALSISCL